jgi:hypothetical protein
MLIRMVSFRFKAFLNTTSGMELAAVVPRLTFKAFRQITVCCIHLEMAPTRCRSATVSFFSTHYILLSVIYSPFSSPLSDLCTTVMVAFYSDSLCSTYVGYFEVVDQQECFAYLPDTFMVSGKMKCVVGSEPLIGTNSTVSRCVTLNLRLLFSTILKPSYYNASDSSCTARPFEFIAVTNFVCLDVMRCHQW